MTSPLPLTIGTSSPSVNPTGPAVPDTTPVKETNRNVNKELGSKGDNKKDMADEIDERSVEVGYSEFIKKFCEHTNELSNVKFKEIQAATRGFFQNLKHIVDNTKESETYSILVRRFSSFPSRVFTFLRTPFLEHYPPGAFEWFRFCSQRYCRFQIKQYTRDS